MDLEIIIRKNSNLGFEVSAKTQGISKTNIIETFAAAFGCVLKKMNIPQKDMIGIVAAAGVVTLDVAMGKSGVTFEGREAEFIRELRKKGLSGFDV